MILKTATFEVRPDGIDTCLVATRTFVAEIEATQPATLVYRSLQDAAEPTRFLNIMLFPDGDAEEIHRSSDATRRFTEFIYPLTVAPPRFTGWTQVAAVDRTTS